MFDLSFWEIMVIGIIAVLVVGPERLPSLAYKAGQWITKVRRFVANAKAEVESEFNTAELRKLMNAQEEEMQRLRKLVEDTRMDVEQSQQLLNQSIEESVQSVRDAASPAPAPASSTAPSTLLDKPAVGDAAPSPAAPPTPTQAMPKHVEASLPPMVAQSIEDEMQALSQSLGETLHRPNFGISADSPGQGATPADKTRA